MSSAPPLIFKRSGKGKPSRTRQATPDDDKDDAASNPAESAEDSPSALAAKLKKKKAKAKSKLSFGGADEEVRVISYRGRILDTKITKEGDGEVFQVKKSKLSTKLALNKLAP